MTDRDELLALTRQLKEYVSWLDRGQSRGAPRRAVTPNANANANANVNANANANANANVNVNVNANANANGADGLRVVREELGDCIRCKLSRGRQNIVFGVGNPDAALVFVGEAPGADEDRQGEPFVGAAGQLLTKMIAAMGLAREDVYICNIIKCRPPGNRNPEPDEIAACEPFLKKQLAAIRPRMIVCLGKFAAQCLLRSEAPISRLRGRFHAYEGIPLMPTFHPAFLLRNPSAKREVWSDLQMVMAELDRLKISRRR